MGPNQIGEKPTLPSALYIPHPDEFPEGAFPLPWPSDPRSIIGLFARDHGALVPDRLVTSAKSWLSNPHIDPRQRSLPWKSEIHEARGAKRVQKNGFPRGVRRALLHLEINWQGVVRMVIARDPQQGYTVYIPVAHPPEHAHEKSTRRRLSCPGSRKSFQLKC